MKKNKNVCYSNSTTKHGEKLIMENQSKNIEIQISDIVNATRIMEYAISKNVFTTKELMEVTPIVVRFQEFSEQVAAAQAEQAKAEAQSQAEATSEEPTPETGE